VIETTDINGDGGEEQAVMYEGLGWVRVDAVRPAFGDGDPIVVDDDVDPAAFSNDEIKNELDDNDEGTT
jgi:hypothetical protein